MVWPSCCPQHLLSQVGQAVLVVVLAQRLVMPSDELDWGTDFVEIEL